MRPEGQPGAPDKPVPGLHALFPIELLENLFNLDLRVGFVGVLPRRARPLQLPDQPEVTVPQLPRLENGPIAAVKLRHAHPEPGGALIGADIHQGAVQVENTVPVSHESPPLPSTLISR